MFFDMQNGITFRPYFPWGWKKSFSTGVILPTRFGNCEKSAKSVANFCDIWRARTTYTIEFTAELNELKRLPLKFFGHLLPYYKVN